MSSFYHICPSDNNFQFGISMTENIIYVTCIMYMYVHCTHRNELNVKTLFYKNGFFRIGIGIKPFCVRMCVYMC